MEQRTAVITGASDGIGAEAAKRLKEEGFRVAVVGRSEKKARAVAAALGAPFYLADFAELAQVRDLAGRLKRDFPRIDVLANNAGGIFRRGEVTPDGHEMAFQVSHLAHFLLTLLLMDVLLESGAAVISTSSVAHRLISCFDPDDPDAAGLPSRHIAYGNAKLANILFTGELHRRYSPHGLHAAAFHPGVVATGFAGASRSPVRLLYRPPFRRLLGVTGPEAGADTLVWLATSAPGKDWQSGGYYKDRRPAQSSAKARDKELALRLWQRSEQMVADFL